MRTIAMIQKGKGFFDSRVNVGIHEIEGDHLQGYYKLLDCDTITMVDVDIDDHEYSIVADDEGLMKAMPTPTLYINDDLVLFGSVCFVKIGDMGETLGLDDDDIVRIGKYIKRQVPKMKPWQRKILASKIGA